MWFVKMIILIFFHFELAWFIMKMFFKFAAQNQELTMDWAILCEKTTIKNTYIGPFLVIFEVHHAINYLKQ